MSLLKVRKLVVQLEEISTEMGRPVDPPARQVTVAAVIDNPYAGRYVEDLSPMYQLGAEVAELIAQRGVQVLGLSGIAPQDVTSYGKGAIVGANLTLILLDVAWDRSAYDRSAAPKAADALEARPSTG